MTTLAIVGKPYTHFIHYLASKKPEIKVLAIQDIKENFTYPENISSIHKIDFSSKESVKNGLSKIKNLKIDGVVANYEASLLPMVWIGEFYGCPVPNEESIIAATDKTLMREKFTKNAPHITPDFTKANTWQDITAFLEKHTFPLVLKPANLMKSLLVTINKNKETLKGNFDYSQKEIVEIYKQYGVFHKKPTLILEEFLAGTTHSIDIISDKDGNLFSTPVVDYITALDKGIEDNYTYARILPSKLTKEEQASVTQCAKDGVEALGLKNSAAHAEVIMTSTGPKIVEIGARFGGYRPRMYQLANGIPIHKLMVDIALGKQIQITQNKQHATAVYELFPTKKGTLKKIVHFDKLKKLPSLKYLNQTKFTGDPVGLSKDGYKFCASIILFNENLNQLKEDMKFVDEEVRVLVE